MSKETEVRWLYQIVKGENGLDKLEFIKEEKNLTKQYKTKDLLHENIKYAANYLEVVKVFSSIYEKLMPEIYRITLDSKETKKYFESCPENSDILVSEKFTWINNCLRQIGVFTEVGLMCNTKYKRQATVNFIAKNLAINVYLAGNDYGKLKGIEIFCEKLDIESKKSISKNEESTYNKLSQLFALEDNNVKTIDIDLLWTGDINIIERNVDNNLEKRINISKTGAIDLENQEAMYLVTVWDEKKGEAYINALMDRTGKLYNEPTVLKNKTLGPELE